MTSSARPDVDRHLGIDNPTSRRVDQLLWRNPGQKPSSNTFRLPWGAAAFWCGSITGGAQRDINTTPTPIRMSERTEAETAPGDLLTCSRNNSIPNRMLESGSTIRSAAWDTISGPTFGEACTRSCLLYTSDAADDLLCVDLGGRRIIK